MFIGLMGVDADGTLYSPSGRRLMRLAPRVSFAVQRIQHAVARLTHR